jgi:hypothetical protein
LETLYTIVVGISSPENRGETEDHFVIRNALTTELSDDDDALRARCFSVRPQQIEVCSGRQSHGCHRHLISVSFHEATTAPAVRNAKK